MTSKPALLNKLRLVFKVVKPLFNHPVQHGNITVSVNDEVCSKKETQLGISYDQGALVRELNISGETFTGC